MAKAKTVSSPYTGSDGETYWLNNLGMAFEGKDDSIIVRLRAVPSPDPKTGEIVLVIKEKKEFSGGGRGGRGRSRDDF